VTDLRSAEKFEQSHLSSPTVARLVDAAKVYYVEGYFLTHGLQSMLEIGKKAAYASKVNIVRVHGQFCIPLNV
jgi:adenosine kinase